MTAPLLEHPPRDPPLLEPALVAAVVPRQPQQAAVDGLLACYRRSRRAQIRMACGVGKTHVGIFTAAAVAARRVIVAVPSLSLVDQTLRVWLPFLARGAQTVAVCSADGVFAHAGPAGGPRTTTTDPGRIGFLLGQDTPALIVTTYDSLPQLATAVRDAQAECRQRGVEHAAGREIDLLVLDEAHHLTGRLNNGQWAALDDAQLPAVRRLAMTATPIIATQADAAGAAGFDSFTSPTANLARAARVVTMDDEQLFGPVAHLYSTRQAIDDGYLCDYEVLVVGQVDTPFNRERLPMAALAAAANERGVARALSFHNWVADARAFSTLLNFSSHPTVRFVADTINGATSAPVRRRILTRLAGPCAPGVVRVVTAAKCLREGVDVCAVDAVLFAAARSSTVEIVQAVGRALRVHPGKRRGTIILPLLVPAGGFDDDEELTASQFAHIWKVLRALNAHDPRISETLTRTRSAGADHRAGYRRGRKAEARPLPAWLHLVGGIDADTVVGRLVSPSNSQWDTAFQALLDVVDEVGSAHRIKNFDVHEGWRVGEWVIAQRQNYRRGVLDPARAERLEQVPGWTWRADSLLDHRLVDRLEQFSAAAGSCRDAAAGDSIYPVVPGAARLGRWLAQTRRARREHRLDVSVAGRLEQLPGWTWEPLTAADRAGVTALSGFVAWEKTAAVPAGHIEDGFALADWLDQKGRAYLAGLLPPELHEEILAVCPTSEKGEPQFAWDATRLRTEAGLAALRQYAAGGGVIIDMPSGHQERVDGLIINLYQWCARQRWLARRGRIEATVQAQLEEVVGWVWDVRAAKVRHGAPIALPAGVEHGRPHTRRHFGCPCRECDLAAREFQAAFKRRQTDALTAGWVTSPAGAARVKTLMAAHPWAVPATVAAAACLPRSLFADLLANPRTVRVPPWLASRLERLHPAELRQWHRGGTRGRDASRAGEPGDPAQQRRNLTRLRTAGWKDAEIGVALGYRGTAARATRDDPSAAMVYATTQLLRTLGPGSSPPTWILTARTPALHPCRQITGQHTEQHPSDRVSEGDVA